MNEHYASEWLFVDIDEQRTVESIYGQLLQYSQTWNTSFIVDVFKTRKGYHLIINFHTPQSLQTRLNILEMLRADVMFIQRLKNSKHQTLFSLRRGELNIKYVDRFIFASRGETP